MDPQFHMTIGLDQNLSRLALLFAAESRVVAPIESVLDRAIGLKHPDLVRLEFDWGEIR